jgi:hypothetical protein
MVNKSDGEIQQMGPDFAIQPIFIDMSRKTRININRNLGCSTEFVNTARMTYMMNRKSNTIEWDTIILDIHNISTSLQCA